MHSLDHVGFMLAYVQMFAGVLLNVLILTGACASTLPPPSPLTA
jgi:hypothetical protein